MKVSPRKYALTGSIGIVANRAMFICTDCAIKIADYDSPLTPRFGLMSQLVLGDYDLDGESTKPCDYCNSPRPGARFHCVVRTND